MVVWSSWRSRSERSEMVVSWLYLVCEEEGRGLTSVLLGGR